VRIIHRYIWKEFIEQFLLCFLGFTALGIGKILFEFNDLFISYRMPLKLIGMLILDKIPTLWMDVIPAAALFGVILSLGRLLREREFDVMRTAGCSLIQITIPICIGVAAICFGAFWWNDLVVSSANHRFEMEVRRLSNQENIPLLKENVVFKGPQNRFIYLNRVDNRRKEITGIMVLEPGAAGKWPRLITAEYGRVKNGIWLLYKGVVHDLDESGVVATELKFPKMELLMSLDYRVMMGDKSAYEMRAKELLEKIKLYGPYNYVYRVYYQQKFADPLISLVLVFLAIPLTMFTGRNNSWLGMVWCFLIIMAYYTLQVIGRTMGCNGVIPPFAAAWIPHILIFSVGLLLFVANEKRR
jgi:lipopolysaccharide export LptBFGC system permease protein LptF